jgi:hypothetical protein
MQHIKDSIPKQFINQKKTFNERCTHLLKEFSNEELEWRVSQSRIDQQGKPHIKILCYVTARAVMNRLDQVFGAGNWQDQYELVSNGVMCKLSIFNFDSGQWITKHDGSDNTEIEPFKGGISKAFVRTAVKWGIGRYLYELGETYAEVFERRLEGSQWAKIRHDNKDVYVYWKPPLLKITNPFKPEALE